MALRGDNGPSCNATRLVGSGGDILHGCPKRRRLLTLVSFALVAAVGLIPNGAAAVSSVTPPYCYRLDYGCIEGTGYSGQSVWGSWPWPEARSAHNCVSYVAYRLSQNGADKPWGPKLSNAIDWDERADKAGFPVNKTPAVGSIAQWNERGGHIAYVDVVTSSYIEVSEDAWLTDTSGYSSTRRIQRSSTTFATANFIHIKDVGNGGGSGDASPADLYFVKTRNTGTGRVEVHVATAASSYKASGGNWGSWFSTAEQNNGWFQMIDMDGDAKLDLVYIKTKRTGSGRVEVHVATAASGYQANGGNWASWFSSAEQNSGWFQMAEFDGDGKPDLVYIKTKQTGSGKVEVHVATARSGYQASGGNWVTWFSSAEQDGGWFQIVGRDLFYIKTWNTGSGRAEVHVATVASGYQATGGNWATWLGSADRSKGWFQMVGRDLFFVRTRNTGSGKVEVHSATASSSYQAAGQHSISWFSPADQSNGWFQVGSKH